MERKRKPAGYWTYERIAEEARRYDNRTAFLKGSPSAYAAAQKHCLLDDVCAHMVGPRVPKGHWTKELLIETAQRYQKRGQFKKENAGAYRAAIRAGVLAEICAHMTSASAPLTKEIVNERLADRGISLIGTYVKSSQKATFRCEYHHEWSATPNSVLGGRGCPACGDRKVSLEEVNKRLAGRGVRVTGKYAGVNKRTEFSCEHGHRWVTTPNSVMLGGGCPKCNRLSMVISKGEIDERLSARGLKMIGEYVNSNTPTLFECEYGHRWNTKPSHLFSGSGCPSCPGYGFDLSKRAIVYYLRVASVTHGNLYKIGVTNRDVESRYSASDLEKITTLKIWPFDTGMLARAFEKEVLAKFADQLWNGEPVLESGNTELFSSDILNLDSPESAA